MILVVLHMYDFSKVVTPAQYQARLEAMGILIKAKNFLVFQVCQSIACIILVLCPHKGTIK